MRAVLISLFCCFAIGAIGQTRFNKVYDRDEDVSGVTLSYYNENELLIFGRRLDSTGQRSLIVASIAANGDTNFYNNYYFNGANMYFHIAGALEELNDSVILLAGTYTHPTLPQPIGALYWYNLKSKALTFTSYSDTTLFEGGQFVKIHGDKIYFFTISDHPVSGKDAYKIYLTDTLGNLLWDTIYGMPNQGLEMRHATIDSQGNCWVGGILNNTTQTYVNHIVKFNHQWQKVGEWTYGEPTFGGSARFQELPNGEMLVYGSIATIFDTLMAYTAIIEGTNQLTDLHYYPDTNSFLSSHSKAILSNENNIVVFLGVTDNQYHKQIALLRKINYVTGEVIWEHRYAYNEQEHHQVYDLTQAPDGGFYIVGSAINFAGNQDVWVVKTDADGCLVENCLVGQEEVVQKVSVSLLAYPNPFTNTVTIELSNLPTTANVTLNYINAQGTVVSMQQLGTLRSTTWQAPIAGLYAVIVWVDGMFYGSSILIAQ